MCYCRFGQNPAPDGFMCHRLAQRSGITSAMKTYELPRWRTRTRTNAYLCTLHRSTDILMVVYNIHFFPSMLGQPFYCKTLLSLHSLRTITITRQNQLLHVGQTYSHLSQQLLKTPRLHSAQGPSLNKRCTHHNESQWPSKPCKSAIAAAQRLD